MCPSVINHMLTFCHLDLIHMTYFSPKYLMHVLRGQAHILVVTIVGPSSLMPTTDVSVEEFSTWRCWKVVLPLFASLVKLDVESFVLQMFVGLFPCMHKESSKSVAPLSHSSLLPHLIKPSCAW